MPIYTRKGDDGTTGLLGGKRVLKNSAVVETLGCVDELNATLGLSIAQLPTTKYARLIKELTNIQNNLFCLGSNLANPTKCEQITNKPPHPPALIPRRPVQNEIDNLEKAIDSYDKILEPLRSFILPGGCQEAATLHLARTVCRRAERAAVSVKTVNPLHIKYLNRLSDYLFTAARLANYKSENKEAMWEH